MKIPFIDNWILHRAEKLQKAVAEKEAAKKEAREKKYKEDQLKVLRYRIYEELDKFAKIKETEPCHIEVGDRVIINYFSIGREGRNGWDGGPGSLLNNIPEEERTAPVTVTITKIYVDKSLAHERVDKFFDNHNVDWLLWNQKATLENIWGMFLSWQKRMPLYKFADNFGLYKTAHFDYEGSFKPKWGLNVDSFLKEGTPEFYKTFDLWSREIEINQKKKSLNRELADLEAEMRKIDEEHRNIKYV